MIFSLAFYINWGMSIFTIFIVIFFLGVIAIGTVNTFRVRTPDSFFVADRNSGSLSTGGSLTATIIGGSSTLGLAGLAFSKGITGAWWLLVGAIGLFCLLFFVKRIKEHKVYTLPELLGKWYGETVRKAASILIAFAWLGIVGAQVSAAGRLISTFFPGNVSIWILISGSVFILYTLAGGQISVIKTDLAQAVLIVIGILTASLLGLSRVGWLNGLHEKLNLSYFYFPVTTNFTLKDLTVLILVVGTTYLIGPDMISRIFCSRTVKTSKRGIAVSILIIVPMAFIIAFIGIEAKALFPGTSGEAAFPLIIREVLPPVLGALTITALLSAFLSSADTTLLTLSAIVSIDIFGIRKRKILIYRLTVLISGIFALVIGIFSGGIISSLLLGYSVFSGGLAVPIIAALAGKPLSKPAALASIITGGVAAFIGKIISNNTLILAAFGITLAILVIDIFLKLNGKKRFNLTE